MDETPIKAGRRERGTMKTGYFWPVYGDKKEIAFPFSPSRAGRMVREVLGEYCGVLLSDGYKVYENHAAEVNDLVHAQCWSHTRRYFIKAEDVEPALAARALSYIGRLYEEEAALKRKHLADARQIEKRSERCKPLVEEFFAWLKAELTERVLLPSNPFTVAAHYTLEREASLRVFLEYPNVPIDTNHLEREIRPIAVGRKNWLFCWTELGAECVGIFQSLLSTCRLHGIDPYVYLVDVLQRVASPSRISRSHCSPPDSGRNTSPTTLYAPISTASSRTSLRDRLRTRAMAAGPVEPVGGALCAPSKELWSTRLWRRPRVRQDPQAWVTENDRPG